MRIYRNEFDLWVIDTEHYLVVTDHDNGYGISIDECTAAGRVTHWLGHMAEKRVWVTPAVMGGLVFALNYALDDLRRLDGGRTITAQEIRRHVATLPRKAAVQRLVHEELNRHFRTDRFTTINLGEWDRLEHAAERLFDELPVTSIQQMADERQPFEHNNCLL
jgi:hypothetical protein